MVYKTIEEALKCVDAYKVDRRVERYHMICATERIATEQGKAEGMTRLNVHLDKHYELRTTTPAMEAYLE